LKQERSSFLKKKNQKTFAPWPPGDETRGANVFCGAFFQKSDLFLRELYGPDIFNFHSAQENG
jgi:hypothetical protein